MWQTIAVYFLLGAILSTMLAITSKHPFPIGREIRAHLAIVAFWPIVLFNMGKIFRQIRKEGQPPSDDDIE